MFTHVLVGVDGGSGGHDAVALAQALVEPDGRITLGNVHEGVVSLWPSVLVWNADQEGESRRLLRDERERAVAASGVTTDIADVAASAPGGGLHRLAERLGVDLLVVGSSRHDRLDRVLIGDDERAALNGAPCAVAVASPGYREAGRITRVGVGYDGSPESEAAVACARGLALRTGAAVEVVEAVDPPAMLAPGPWGDVLEDLTAESRHRIEALEGVVGSVAHGSPAHALVALSERVDLLIVGSRGYGPVRRMLFGSTSTQVQRHASCSVLTLTRAAAPAESPDRDAVGTTTT